MSAVFKRKRIDEGMEMPVREVVSRAMLCAMLDLDENEPLYIYDFEGREEACLLVLEAEFTPKKAGDYFIKLESEVLREQREQKAVAAALARAPVVKFEEEDFKEIESLPQTYSKETIIPVNVIYDPRYQLLPRKPPPAEKPFAVLKRLNNNIAFHMFEGQAVSKEKICRFFTLHENVKYFILTPSDMLVKEFSEMASKQDKNNFFMPAIRGDYIFLSEAEFSRKKKNGYPVKEPSKLSYRTFCRLSIAGRAMLPSLQIMYPKKESPLFLNVVTNPCECDNFGFVMSRKNPSVMDPKAEIHPYHLGDLRPFVLQGIVVQGDIDKCDRRECLLNGCRAIQTQKLTYKTFVSHFNPMSIVVEMMTILKPKRAEIWLCRIDNRHGAVARRFDDELTGEDWPFESAAEEVKIVTSTARYLDDMQRSGRLFPFLSRVKFFEAIIVSPLISDIFSQFFQEFQAGADLGKLQITRFVVREISKSSILGGVRRNFEYEYEDDDWQKTNGLEYQKRFRAGIVDDNAEQIAILEMRTYCTFSVVTAVFTSVSSYQGELDKIYKKIDGLQKTVDRFFKN